MKYVKLTCSNCGERFRKAKKEVTRQRKRGRINFFCTLTCGAHHNNALPHVRAACIESGRRLAKRMYTPMCLHRATLGHEGWKYEKLKRFLDKRDIVHLFEYPLVTKQGKIRLYDLAIRDVRVLIEFDGDYHYRNGKAYDRRDEQKNRLAKARGWKLLRIPVTANTVIPSSVIRHLTLQ